MKKRLLMAVIIQAPFMAWFVWLYFDQRRPSPIGPFVDVLGIHWSVIDMLGLVVAYLLAHYLSRRLAL